MSTQKNIEDRGIEVVIAGAGGAAHLPGMIASLTTTTVLGVPVESKALKGIDSLLSIVQMPAGVPLPTLAIGKAGAINASLAAISILGNKYPQILKKLKLYRSKITKSIKKLQKMRSLGIIGGGQLGMFICQAAKSLELKPQSFQKTQISAQKNFVINILLGNSTIMKFWKIS